MKSLKYSLFKLWKNRQYKKFLKNENWEFDHSSITSFLELKLTVMGLYFAKFGITVDETRKHQVRTIWQARKHIKNYVNAFNIVEERCQKKFIEKYGCRHELELRFENVGDKKYTELVIDCISNVPDKEEAEAFWSSLDVFTMEYTYGKEQLKLAFDIIHEHLQGWWD